jgi:dihydrofolate reductase
MRKLVVTNIVSLDGFHEGPGKDVMAMPMDHSFDTYNLQRLEAADTLLLGRTTFELFRDFWPKMADHPEASEANRRISRLNDTLEKLVVSDTLEDQETSPWRDTTTIVRRSNAHVHVAELKRQDGRDILTFGSRTLWNDLLAAGLVDELHLVIGAGVVGGGTPAFRTPVRGLRLLGTWRGEASNNIVLRYGVSG